MITSARLMACLETQKHPSHTSPTSTGNSTSPALLESKLTFDQRKSKKNETSVTETTAAATTEVDVSTVMTVEVDLTETIEADDLSAMIVEITAAIGTAPSATTTISLSGRNAIDAVNQEETVVADQTTEDSNAEMTDVVATDLVAMTDAVVTEEETTARTTEWTATGIAPSATMTTLHGELNATNVELQRAAVEDDLLAEMTDVVATDLVATTDVVATEAVAMTDVVATDVVATEAVAMTDVVATEAVATADHLAVNQENNANLENSGRLVGRDRAMLTTDHLVI